MRAAKRSAGSMSRATGRGAPSATLRAARGEGGDAEAGEQPREGEEQARDKQGGGGHGRDRAGPRLFGELGGDRDAALEEIDGGLGRAGAPSG
jgi:hypothetical protein